MYFLRSRDKCTTPKEPTLLWYRVTRKRKELLKIVEKVFLEPPYKALGVVHLSRDLKKYMDGVQNDYSRSCL